MEDLRSGFILVNKPIGITSAQCLNKIKRLLPRKIKIGHAGTLDSFASGLLVVGVGRPATKKLHNIMLMDKHYTVTGRLGIETDTLDKTGTVVKREDVQHISKRDLEKTLESFGPSYYQVPPLYSALKHNGKRLSDLTRGQKLSSYELGALVATKAKTVNIYSVQLTDFTSPFFTCTLQVSHGTYIRSLVRDIGLQLGTCAMANQLCRTAIGGFLLEEAIDLDDLLESGVSRYMTILSSKSSP